MTYLLKKGVESQRIVAKRFFNLWKMLIVLLFTSKTKQEMPELPPILTKIVPILPLILHFSYCFSPPIPVSPPNLPIHWSSYWQYNTAPHVGIAREDTSNSCYILAPHKDFTCKGSAAFILAPTLLTLSPSSTALLLRLGRPVSTSFTDLVQLPLCSLDQPEEAALTAEWKECFIIVKTKLFSSTSWDHSRSD